MRNNKCKRFGVHEVKSGKYTGCLHVATTNYQKFASELMALHNYLRRRIMPAEPEEEQMQGILLNLQNILEYECEELVRYHVGKKPSNKNRQFLREMEKGFVSFKKKFEWLKTKGLLQQGEADVMESIRVLRNQHTHTRPVGIRLKFKYAGKALMTRTSVRQMFVDVEVVLRSLRRASRRKATWSTVPPGYASETKWTESQVKAINDGRPGDWH